jgi:hypothetical protein
LAPTSLTPYPARKWWYSRPSNPPQRTSFGCHCVRRTGLRSFTNLLQHFGSCLR